jgi:WD40 repeat protein
MSMLLGKEGKGDLLYVGFNQDYGCFAVGTEKGFAIYNCDPLKERFRRDFGAGICIVEMLFRCNILALVGGGKNPKFPPNKVMIWDDFQNKCIAELEFRSEVKAVKLRRDRIVVVLDNKIYVYNFVDLKLLHQIETTPNPKGLCALSPNNNNAVLACPGLKPGTVHVELYDSKKTQLITAHTNAMSQIALNIDGTRLATASEKGTLIRVFDTETGQRLQELRRGADRAEIFSITFSPTSNYLVVSSDKGTVHVYGLQDATSRVEEQKNAMNRQSSLSFIPFLPAYFSSEWSFAQFHLPEARCICAFGSVPTSVVVVCANGQFYKYTFDPTKGGEGKQELIASFVQKE